MPALEPKGIKLRHLSVRNFKVLDSLEIDFHPPLMKHDPDVIVLGGKNGWGKTSVLESCALLVLAPVLGGYGRLARDFDLPLNLEDLLIRAGARRADIEGNFVYGERGLHLTLKLTIGRANRRAFWRDGDLTPFREAMHDGDGRPLDYAEPRKRERLVRSLVGLSADPLIAAPFLYFHSYRKVEEGNIELGTMLGEDRGSGGPAQQRPRGTLSAFKREILRCMMSRADLLEEVDDEQAEEAFAKLNGLMQEYAGGTIEKLRASPDSTVELRITPEGGGQSFTFDGLSSGQKEIISTLFLIWRYTRTRPGIVLIDEPELYLNVEWHWNFVQKLHELAPENQYILATHSEDVFASVPSDRRLLLAPVGESKR